MLFKTNPIIEWTRHWALEADMVRCVRCHGIQLATDADREFVHLRGCTSGGAPAPWAALALALDHSREQARRTEHNGA
ncbi:hypothetical protein [Pseudomonas sp. NPDC007930]|uniref:hypothetical protein n=1 Tax=Pseudomonas sp. NPDC007930 TaxID=3364417 RepID=UPI0036E064AE